VVLVAAAADRPLLHRVVSTSNDEVTTRGDACDAADAPASRSAVVARAVAVARGARITVLAPSLRFGAPALARLAASRARLLVARRARRARTGGASLR
jgi:hypothetical protein